MKLTLKEIRLPIIVLVMIMTLMFPSSVFAVTTNGTITVNTTADEYGTGASCSLREAIESANTDSDFGGCTRVGTTPYAINIPAGTYNVDIAGSDEDDNVDGDLDIKVSMNFVGAGADQTTIDGNDDERVFHIIGAVEIFFYDMKI